MNPSELTVSSMRTDILHAAARRIHGLFRRATGFALPAYPYEAAVRAGCGFRIQARLLPQWVMRRVVRVPTKDVAYTLLGIQSHIPWRKKLFVRNGDWRSSLVSYRGHEAVWQIFVEGRPYRETDQYREMRRLVDSGNPGPPWPWCRAPEDVEQYFRNLFSAYEDIRDNGYRSQAELGTGKAHDEVGVNIGPGGELAVIRGGTHRLAMAHVLNVPIIPAVVFGVHRDWALQCYRRHGGPLDSALARSLEEMASSVDSLPRTGRRHSRARK
jgi:hypothetical protein